MKASRVARGCAVVLVAAGALGCGKTGSKPDATPPGLPGGGQGPVDEPPVGVDPQACNAPQPGPTPLHRLTGFELGNTVRNMFQDAPDVSTALQLELEDLPSNNYFDDPSSNPTAVAVDTYHRLAHQAALSLSADAAALGAFAGCDPVADGEAACGDQLIERVLRRTYRKVPTSDELGEMQEVFALGQQLGGDFASGARAVLEVALQSPDFLYLVEQGVGEAEDGAVALSHHETAARLAYFLTGSAPDAELAAAADAAAVGENDIEAQARRLLGTPPNRQVARHFYEQLLRLGHLDASVSPNPAYTPQILALTREETGRFIEDITFDGAGTFEALLTEPSTWVNAPLAAFYGDIPDIAGDGFRKVQLNPQRRAGLLTQSAFLTATSPGGRTHPVMRGLAVLTKVLCVEMPPPPADIDITVPETIPDPATTRQRYEAAITAPACLDCHRKMDPIGFAFENYDAYGLWRESELGLPIDASGTLTESDAQGSFANAIELLGRIATSDDAHACFVGNWLSYAYGRQATPEDACTRQDLETAFRDSDGNIKELLVAISKTDQLRYRLASELAP